MIIMVVRRSSNEYVKIYEPCSTLEEFNAQAGDDKLTSRGLERQLAQLFLNAKYRARIDNDGPIQISIHSDHSGHAGSLTAKIR